MTELKILLTNDDGIHSVGLQYLWEALKPHAKLFIAAPKDERSGSSTAVTFGGPLSVESIDCYPETPAWKIGGTPADCVRLALEALLDTPPDLIVSGINHGSNAGRNVLYSGTVGGAIEGVLRGIPGIALSYFAEINHFPHIKKFIPRLVGYLTYHPLPKGTLLNVNFPDIPEAEIKGYKMARQGRSYWIEKAKKNTTSEGNVLYHLKGESSSFEEHEESDISLLKRGYITAVPIHIDELTDHAHFQQKKEDFDRQLNNKELTPFSIEPTVS